MIPTSEPIRHWISPQQLKDYPVIESAAIRLHQNTLISFSYYSPFLGLSATVLDHISRHHGARKRMVQDAPQFNEFTQQLRRWYADSELYNRRILLFNFNGELVGCLLINVTYNSSRTASTESWPETILFARGLDCDVRWDHVAGKPTPEQEAKMQALIDEILRSRKDFDQLEAERARRHSEEEERQKVRAGFNPRKFGHRKTAKFDPDTHQHLDDLGNNNIFRHCQWILKTSHEDESVPLGGLKCGKPVDRETKVSMVHRPPYCKEHMEMAFQKKPQETSYRKATRKASDKLTAALRSAREAM